MRRAAGFTLLEVLLATTLLAAALALAFATLRAAGASVERGEAQAARNERMRAVSSFLRQRIGGAPGLVFGLDAASGASTRFEGDARSMRFVADLPDYLGRGGPYLHELSVAGGDDGLALDVGFRMLQAGQAMPATRPPEALAAGLRTVRFSYRSVDAQGVPAARTDRWDAPQAMPLQVRVQVADARGAWPDMVVALPVAGAYVVPAGALP
ncbi:MAG: general secretion pathway protein GspJ [Variovorax sp.]|nr:MAG: general secretion pathway protein GspJ [Variovorax sp.]